MFRQTLSGIGVEHVAIKRSFLHLELNFIFSKLQHNRNTYFGFAGVSNNRLTRAPSSSGQKIFALLSRQQLSFDTILIFQPDTDINLI